MNSLFTLIWYVALLVLFPMYLGATAKIVSYFWHIGKFKAIKHNCLKTPNN